MTERLSDLACREIVEFVTEYLEGAMAPERMDLFEQHVVFCEGCDTYLDQMRQSIALSGSLGITGLGGGGGGGGAGPGRHPRLPAGPLPLLGGRGDVGDRARR